jgi:hypothetical protein
VTHDARWHNPQAEEAHYRSHHWAHPTAREESEIIDTFYVHWASELMLWEIEADEGFALQDLLQDLGRLKLQAMGYVKHGDVPPDEGRTDERL